MNRLPMQFRETVKIIQMAQDMPWLVENEIRRILSAPLFQLLSRFYGVDLGRKCRLYGMPIIQRHRGSLISLDDEVELRSWTRSNPLVPQHPVVLSTRTPFAQIKIGAGTGMTGTTIVAAEYIEIGKRVLLGANTTIMDTNFHPLTPAGRRENILNGKHAPVVINDDVFIGMNSVILKGVTIGAGAVIGAGSVVTRDVAPGWLAAGNPARPVKLLSPSD
jgi:carbonic anhydrase/acetyltransferase-like protein (isoleucine patch superfamily)